MTRKTRKSASKEAPILKAILQFLEAKRIWHWRNNSGMRIVESGNGKQYRIQFAPTGSPDILLVVGAGRLCGLEVKSPTGRQNENQILWERRAIEEGVGYAVVRSVTDAAKAIERWRQPLKPNPPCAHRNEHRRGES